MDNRQLKIAAAVALSFMGLITVVLVLLARHILE